MGKYFDVKYIFVNSFFHYIFSIKNAVLNSSYGKIVEIYIIYQYYDDVNDALLVLM